VPRYERDASGCRCVIRITVQSRARGMGKHRRIEGSPA
jgi:hypothetical protein